MDFKEIQELIRIVGESNLTTVEVEREGFRILLQKETEKIVVSEKYSNGGIAALPQFEQPQAAAVSPAGTESRPSHKTINSPIVGTFYASSTPGGAPFVQPGSKVSKGDTLCIVEAMKLMNEIEAEEDLEIVEVLVKDGEMVQYGQSLFAISK